MLDFVQKRNWYYLLSLLVLLPGVISLIVPPALKPGIEFSSGSMLEVSFQNPVKQQEVRDEISALGHPEATVQSTGPNRYLIRTSLLSGSGAQAPEGGPQPIGEQQSIVRALFDKFGPMLKDDGSLAVDSAGNPIPWTVQSSAVSSTVSREIGQKSMIAVAVASVAILLYISWAFRSIPNPFRCGIAATIATMHDVVLVMGAYSIFGKVFNMEVNTMFITGLLTVIGFSVHDTIVVLDRIRENRSRYPDLPLHEVVNNSILQTLGRSINTSFTVILAVTALLLIGGVTIRPFLVVMLIGTITGTYSSIFVASQILVTWEEGDIPRLFRRITHIIPRRAGTVPEEG
jgi:preprotein translocase subunit SecF